MSETNTIKYICNIYKHSELQVRRIAKCQNRRGEYSNFAAYIVFYIDYQQCLMLSLFSKHASPICNNQSAYQRI